MDISRRKITAAIIGTGGIIGGSLLFSGQTQEPNQEPVQCEELIFSKERSLERGEIYSRTINGQSNNGDVTVAIRELEGLLDIQAVLQKTNGNKNLTINKLEDSPTLYQIKEPLSLEEVVELTISGEKPTEPNQTKTLLDTTESLDNEDSVTIRTDFESSELVSYSVTSTTDEGTITVFIRDPNGELVSQTEYSGQGAEEVRIDSTGQYELEFAVNTTVKRDWNLSVEKQTFLPQPVRFSVTAKREYLSDDCD